jgi:hypothetical protein
MLQENTSLESLFIQSHTIEIKAEEFFVLITSLQHNTTLKSLDLKGSGSLTLAHDEDKQMASLLKNNYALEILPNINNHQGGDVGSILRLNEAGRRYLVQDGSSISKGVEVLCRVNNEINCVFCWHLLENPRLCGQRAVEMTSAAERNGRSTNPTASTGSSRGKRKQASAHKGNESRRRLA